jgi:hypothetical protein
MRTITGKPELSQHDFNEFSHKILWYINKGSGTIHLKELAYKLGVKNNDSDTRKIRLTIKELAKTYPIISSDDGYFWCENESQLQNFIDYHRAEIKSRCVMLAKTKKVCREWINKTVQLPMI